MGLGCNECRGGYFAFKINSNFTNTHFCTSSMYLQSQSQNLPSISNFVKNCESYTIKDDKPFCKKCIGNNVVSEDGRNCYEGL